MTPKIDPEVNIKAKPCPFCDREELLGMLSIPETSKDGPVRAWFVYCKFCKADGPQDASPSHAVERWNRRPR